MRYARGIFFAGLYVCLLLVEFCLTSITDLHNVAHTVLRVLTPIVELSLAAMICAWFARCQRRSGSYAWLAPCLLVAFVYCSVYLAQCYSLYLSNNFISTLAMQNTDSKSVAGSSAFIAAGVGISVVWTLWFAAGALYQPRKTSKMVSTGVEGWSRRRFATVLLALLVINASMLVIPERGQKLEPSFLRPPMTSLIRNGAAALQPPSDNLPARSDKVNADGVMKDGEVCFSYPKPGVDRRYPFEKRVAYKDALPFPSRHSSRERPNVIIFFTEGESARMFGAYGGHYPGLTPNVDKLASISMKVVNYFNHTAPTYRGLIGQTSSGYSFPGGAGGNGWESGANKSKLAQIERQTLATILNKRGYQTYFFSPHHEAAPFTVMLRSLGFHQVYTLESIGNGLLGGKFNRTADALDDQGLFKGLTTFLTRRAASNSDKPFFIATYDFGTHAFIDTTKNGVKYGSGGNEALDTLHNYDTAIGSFLDYFYNSPYASNTIVIFTSDHAKYPDKPYIEVAGADLKHYFVDRIPLLIFDPFHVLPKTYDAGGRNSLALAPTVLQLLGIRKVNNSFLGHSLFEPRNFQVGLTALAGSFYVTTRNGVFGSAVVPSKLEPIFKCERSVVERYYSLERKNRLFPHEHHK